jgi:hypothetical protein
LLRGGVSRGDSSKIKKTKEIRRRSRKRGRKKIRKGDQQKRQVHT